MSPQETVKRARSAWARSVLWRNTSMSHTEDRDEAVDLAVSGVCTCPRMRVLLVIVLLPALPRHCRSHLPLCTLTFAHPTPHPPLHLLLRLARRPSTTPRNSASCQTFGSCRLRRFVDGKSPNNVSWRLKRLKCSIRRIQMCGFNSVCIISPLHRQITLRLYRHSPRRSYFGPTTRLVWSIFPSCTSRLDRRNWLIRC